MNEKEKKSDRLLYILLGAVLAVLLLLPAVFAWIDRPEQGDSLTLSAVDRILINRDGDFTVCASENTWQADGKSLSGMLQLSQWTQLGEKAEIEPELEIKLGDDYWLGIGDGYAYVFDSYAYPYETEAYYSIPENVAETVDAYILQQTESKQTDG